jgi:DNA-binding response OmpR family regulator
MRIAVVEDEEVDYAILVMLLDKAYRRESNNVDIVHYLSVKDLLGSDPDTFDVVLLDLYDHGVGGPEMVQRVSDAIKPPVIVVTGMPSVEIEQQCKIAGADGYLVKGYFGVDQLIETIERVVNGQRRSSDSGNRANGERGFHESRGDDPLASQG